MKTKFYAWATLFCLTGTLAAADAVSDWTGRDSKPSNLTSGTDCCRLTEKSSTSSAHNLSLSKPMGSMY